MKWTDEQWQAINERDCNLLVAAAAGSGKTAVLVERIVRFITDKENPVDIDRLLVVTFTNAAAAEMRERIGIALEKLESHGEPLIKKQRRLLDCASITTIHAFCTGIIRENFHFLDIDPGFRIGEETECRLLLTEALDTLFREKYEKKQLDKPFISLLNLFSSVKRDEGLREVILSVYRFVKSCPFPAEWLDNAVGKLSGKGKADFSESVYGKVLIDTVRLQLEDAIDFLNEAYTLSEMDEDFASYRPVIQEECDSLRQCLASCDKNWDGLYQAIMGFSTGRLKPCKRNADEITKAKIQELRKRVKRIIEDITKKYIPAPSRELFLELVKLKEPMEYLGKMLLDLDSRYRKLKDKRSILDFNDLEHFCLELLYQGGSGERKTTDVAAALRRKYDYILVDEYQDSNLVQEMILKAVSQESGHNNNLFMVGDVKQSIYRFRQARPELFLEKYLKYPKTKENGERKILLYKNFRSRKTIIQAVNFLFHRLMSEKVGELDYSQTEALVPGMEYPLPEGVRTESPVELHLIEYSPPEEIPDGDEEREELEKIQAEAAYTALCIRRLVEGTDTEEPLQVYDKTTGKMRPVTFRDITILLRTTRSWSDIYIEELSNWDIPVYADVGEGYFRALEVRAVFSLLDVLDNPRQDIPLISVLRSPFFHFGDDELAIIRRYDQQGIFYSVLKEYAQSENPLAQKCKNALEKIQRWRERSEYLGVNLLLEEIFEETSFLGFVTTIPGGLQRRANLQLLLYRAGEYEKSSYKGLYHFVRYMAQVRESQRDFDPARLLGEDCNVVRLMSIHKSKGLEFPVVFIGGCGKQFNLRDLNEKLLLHQELGFGSDYRDMEKNIIYPSAAKQALRVISQREQLSEELRVLYVALTRAREHLILTGQVKNVQEIRGRIENGKETGKLHPARVLAGKSFLDWMILALSGYRDKILYTDEDIADESKICRVISSTVQEISKQREAYLSSRQRMAPVLQDVKNRDGIADEVERRLSWEYPFRELGGIPSKITVTGLKSFEQEHTDEYEMPFIPHIVEKPRFMMYGKNITGTGKGTITHFFMQHIDIKMTETLDEIKNQANLLVSKGLMTEEQIEALEFQQVYAFFQSPVGKRMQRARELTREMPFTLYVPVSDLPEHRGVAPNEHFILQGVIDVWFVEGEDIILLDYKTDKKIPKDDSPIDRQYQTQIAYYAKALESMTGLFVKEKYLYYFAPGKLIKIKGKCL